MQPERIQQLLKQERDLFQQQTVKSLAALRRMNNHLPLGVASAYQSQPPYPIVVERANGQCVWDLDGHKYLDLHAGFGANVFGHAHPAIVQAIQDQAAEGGHYAHPTLKLGDYTAALCNRFELDQVRLANSGSEATMEALRLARAYTGRQKIVRFEGGYHGHHDLVMVSMKPNPEAAGDQRLPKPVLSTRGVIKGTVDEVIPLHFNDLDSIREVLQGEEIAAVILEPIMCNLGLVRPDHEFMLELRQACSEYGTVLIWDQVKTGGTVSWNGANSLFPDALPDLHCLGKMIGGGLPVGAYGGKRDIMRLVSEGQVEGYGTFNGNALTVAAGHAALSVMTKEEYARLGKIGMEVQAFLSELISDYDLPAYADQEGLKGGIFWAPIQPRNYREYLQSVDRSLAQLCQVWLANRGILVAPGADEQWTLCTPIKDIEDLKSLQDALFSLAEAISLNS